jgi:NAD(P)H-dependent FMN reductase
MSPHVNLVIELGGASMTPRVERHVQKVAEAFDGRPIGELLTVATWLIGTAAKNLDRQLAGRGADVFDAAIRQLEQLREHLRRDAGGRS